MFTFGGLPSDILRTIIGEKLRRKNSDARTRLAYGPPKSRLTADQRRQSQPQLVRREDTLYRKHNPRNHQPETRAHQETTAEPYQTIRRVQPRPTHRDAQSEGGNTIRRHWNTSSGSRDDPVDLLVTLELIGEPDEEGWTIRHLYVEGILFQRSTEPCGRIWKNDQMATDKRSMEISQQILGDLCQTMNNQEPQPLSKGLARQGVLLTQ
jgi:hypothetical protein